MTLFSEIKMILDIDSSWCDVARDMQNSTIG